MNKLSPINHKYCVTAVRFYDYILKKDENLRKKISQKTGIKPSLLSHMINQIRPGNIDDWEKIADYFGMSLQGFIDFGMSKLEGPGIKPADDVEWEHYKIIKQFKNKHAAKDLNSLLVKYEKLKPTILYKIITELENEIEQIEANQHKKEDVEDSHKAVSGES